MRELGLIVITSALCLVAPFYPRFGVLAYVWFGLMRPDILAWSQHTFYSSALAIASLIGCARVWRDAVRWFTNPITFTLLLLVSVIVLSAVFAVTPSLCTDPLTAFLRMILMTLLVPMVVKSERDMKWLIVVMGFSVGIIGFKFGIWGLAHGGVRFNGGIGGFMSDNNTMATGLAMSVPLCWYGRHMTVWKWLKYTLALFALSSVSAIVMTHSRGGALGLAATCLAMVSHSRRKVLGLLLVAATAFPAVYMVKESYFARMETLSDPEAELSARTRIEYAHAAVSMWRDYPVLGVGFGTLNEIALIDGYIGTAGGVLHNTYLQMLVDSGTLALILYLALLWGTIIWLGVSISQIRQRSPGSELYPIGIQAALIAFAVSSTFLSQVRFDFLYMLLAAAAAWYRMSKDLPPIHDHLSEPPL